MLKKTATLMAMAMAMFVVACSGGDDVNTDCGSGTIEGDEVCDGTNLAGMSCVDLGGDFIGGTLGCSSDCLSLDTSACTTPCGNGDIDEGESCDGTNLDGASCTDIEGFVGGTLGCSNACEFDTSGCMPTTCGNGVVDPGEQCDGDEFASWTCANAPDTDFAGGVLACTDTCQLDTSGCGSEDCTNEVDDDDDGDVDCADADCLAACCGNGQIDPGEVCDGDLVGTNTCLSEGFESGDIACTDICTLDVSQCVGCGNDVVDGSDECDGTDMGSSTCENEGFPGGGTLACNNDCTYDTSGCSSSTCGDNTIDTGEDCDGTAALPDDCIDLAGFDGGTLACNNSTCQYDTSGCYANEDCVAVGDEDNDGYLECNDQDCAGHANCTAQATCSTNCMPPACQQHESCDQYDIPANTCAQSPGQPCTMGGGLLCGGSDQGICSFWGYCICT